MARFFILALALLAPPAFASEPGGRPDGAVGADADEVHEPLTLEVMPRLIEHVEAAYPPAALEARLEAVVRLEIWVDEQGEVTRVSVVEPVGHGFDEAARVAATHFRFEPARTRLGPVPVAITYDYAFVMREPEPEPEPSPPPAGSLFGTVLIAGARLPLAAAQICIDEIAACARSGNDGSFRLDDVAEGTYTVMVTKGGFHSYDTTEEIGAGQSVEVTYYVRRRTSEYEVVVRSKRDKKEVTVHTIDREEVARMPGTMGDPVRVVQNLPGVARAPFGTGLIAVRGSAPEDSGVFVDGHPVPILFHFLGGPSVLPFEIVDNVSLYPGGTGPEYGNHAAGIIDVRTRPGRRERIFGQAEVDLLDAGLLVEGPAGDHGSWVVGGRKSYFELFLPAVLPDQDEGTSLRVAPSYWDYQLRYDHRTDGRRLSVFALGSDDQLSYVRKQRRQNAVRRDRIYVRTMWHRLIATWEQELTDDVTLVVSPSAGYDWGVFGRQPTRFDTSQVTGNLRTWVEWQVLPSLAATAGLDTELYQLQVDATLPITWEGINFPTPAFGDSPPKTVELDGWVWRLSPYLELAWKPTERLTILPGIRIDVSDFAGNDLLGIDPRLTCRYRLNDTVTLKGNVGSFSQWPFPISMFQNKTLDTEHTLQGTLGAELTLPYRLFVDIQGFAKYRWDVAVFDETAALAGEISALPLRNVGKGRAVGFELLARRQLADGVFGWLSYTLQKAESFEPTDSWFPHPYDQTHIFTVLGSWEFADGWTAGARFRLVTGNPVTPVVGAVFDGDANAYEAVSGARNSDRISTFHQLDLRVDKTFTFDTWYLSLYADVQNVYNHQNPEGYQYAFDYSERVEIPGLPIVPTVGIKGEF